MADDDNIRSDGPNASTKDLGKPSSVALPKKIGHYSIKRIIASGGMGTVYLAQQESPRRVVALKVMKKGLASKSALRRFEYESQILARLKHTNIAHVYEAGTHDDGEGGVPYFAMEYIANAKTIIKYVRAKKLSTRELLRLFIKICDAVHHGHQKGIIHRDLKPGNILVDSGGEPKIIDFGVARATDSDMAITTLQTDIGQLIGTLQYMSPEQCDADPHDLDTRSDVYALGVVLYELLTEQLPYDVSKVAMFEAARVIREETPAKPSTINKTLRGDVETITLKALEKERERRYTSAEAFGEDIRRYLSDEPIAARPASKLYQLQRFARRHRVAVGGVAVVFVVLMLATIVSISFLFQANNAKNSLKLEVNQRQRAEQTALSEATAAKESEQLARESEQVAIQARRDAEWQAYVASFYAFNAAMNQGNLSAAKHRLSRAPDSFRNWEWFYYTEQFDQSIYAREYPGAIAFSPDSQRLASGSVDNTIILWDVTTGEELTTLEGHEDWVVSISFSPDGRLLASTSTDKTIKLWEVATGKKLSTLVGLGSVVNSVLFFRDGQLLVSVLRDDTIKLWDVATGKVLATMVGHEDKVSSVAFSPDGRRLASASEDHTIKLWDVATGEVVVTLDGHEDKVQSVTFSPDGQRLASISSDNMIKLWDVTTGEELAALEGHEQWIESVAFSPDGKLLASASYDKMIKLWDVATGEELATLVGHESFVSSVAFSPDGQRLASGSDDHMIKLWDVTTGEELATLEGHEAGVHSVAFSPDGRQLVSEEIVDRIKLWDVTTGEELTTLKGHKKPVFSVAFSADGHRLASGSSDGTIKIWDVATGEELATLEGHVCTVYSVAFSPDGQRLASGSLDKTIKLWDVPTGEELATLEGHEGLVSSLRFHRTASCSRPHRMTR